jgi:hypothetical protein
MFPATFRHAVTVFPVTSWLRLGVLMLSVTPLLARYHPLPDIWGEGALFAFSGFDGPTCAASNFVLAFGHEPFDLVIQTAEAYLLKLRGAGGGRVLAATGDVLAVEMPAGELVVTFSAWHTVIGQLPPGVTVELLPLPPVAGADPRTPRYRPQRHAGAEAVVLRQAPETGQFAAAYGETPEQAAARAEAGLLADVAAAVAARLAFFARIPEPPANVAPVANRLHIPFLRKCASVMKVNTLAAEGAIGRRWSTPDRVPHQHMWLWDSVFHSFAMNRVDPVLANDFLLAVLEAQRGDGMIPHMMTTAGRNSEITQPPLLAWAVWENYLELARSETGQSGGMPLARLAAAFPRLEAYLAWNGAHRDRNGNGLLEWAIEANERSRSGESGMDNCARFDAALTLDAPDFSAYQAHDMACLARIADALGLAERAAFWRDRSRAMSQAIHAQLWNPARQFYCDRDMAGAFIPVRAVSGFMPLLLDDTPADHVDALERALRDPTAFGAACPIPSIALDEPAWSTDMWRGAAWINMNTMTIIGLARHGRTETATWLAERTLAFVQEAYAQYGVLFEFYDARGQRPPMACDRKGPVSGVYDIRARYEVIRDYHWTAALCFDLMLRPHLTSDS